MADRIPESQLGPVLNIVERRTCPTCNTPGAMHVHPTHRVYRPCGHAFRLPPLPSNGPLSTKRRCT